MPRPPRRPRPAPAPTQASRAPPRSPSPEATTNDGRGRTKTRITGKLSAEEENMIRAANRNRDTALERLANKDATTTTGSSGNERDGSHEETAEGQAGRDAETPALHRRDMSGLDMADDSLFGDLDASFSDGGAGGLLPDGLRSTDASVLSMSNFRGRSRQSSFIGRNDPPIRPSSRGGTTPGFGSSFNIGAFRRRAREPSILGASRKPLQGPAGNSNSNERHGEEQGEIASEGDGEEDFEIEPEAESTPLNHRRRTRQSMEPRRSPAEADSPGLTGSRKRKSEDAQHSTIRPEKTPRTEGARKKQKQLQDSDSELSDVQSAQQHQDSDSELSDLPSPQEPPDFLRRPATPMQVDHDDDDEVNAPPASSGSESGADVWPDIRGLAKKRRRPSITTPTKADNQSDISSPPSLTHSPNFEDVKAKAARGRSTIRQQQQQQASPKLTTADLTNLLPKRRYKKPAGAMGADSDEELDTAGLGDEDDELSYLDAQAARRRKGSRAPSRATSARPASRGGRAGPKARQGQHSRTGSDKENEDGGDDEDMEDGEDVAGEGEGEGEGEEGSRFVPLADDTFDEGAAAAPTGGVRSADELRQASRKFKEVDKWELEFEEVAEASSPQDGR